MTVVGLSPGTRLSLGGCATRYLRCAARVKEKTERNLRSFFWAALGEVLTMHKHRSVVGWWCRLFLLLCWVPLVTPQAYAGAAQRLRASKQPVPENTARGDAAVDTYKQGRLKLDYGDGAEEAGSVPPQHAGIVPPQERARGSRPVQHDSEVAGKRQSWQRNWTHYHARADANSNHRERPMNPAYQWGSDANPKTPHDEEAKGNFDWDPDTDPDQPNPMTEEQRLSAFHEERKTLPTNQHKEALLKLKGQEWDSCEKVDGREVPISEQYPLAYESLVRCDEICFVSTSTFSFAIAMNN